METLKDILDSGQEISKGSGRVVNWDQISPENKEKVLALEVYRVKVEDTKWRTTYKLFNKENNPTGLFIGIRKNPETITTSGGFEILAK